MLAAYMAQNATMCTEKQRVLAKTTLEGKPRAVTKFAMTPERPTYEPQGLGLLLSDTHKGVKRCMNADRKLSADSPFPDVYEPPSSPLAVGDEAFLREIGDINLSQDELLDLFDSLPIEGPEPSSPVCSETEPHTDDFEAHLPTKKRTRALSEVNLTGPNTDLGSSRTLSPLSMDAIGRCIKSLSATTRTVTWKDPLTTTAPSQPGHDTCDHPHTFAHVAQHGKDLSGFSPLGDFKTSLSVIEAWAGEPTTPPQTPPTEIHAFVPINNATERGSPSGEPNGGDSEPNGAAHSVIATRRQEIKPGTDFAAPTTRRDRDAQPHGALTAYVV